MKGLAPRAEGGSGRQQCKEVWAGVMRAQVMVNISTTLESDIINLAKPAH